ncbi:MAG: hypothetical protein AB1453_10235 [Chloroflexota bacterium]|jgi:hypothetical protein
MKIVSRILIIVVLLSLALGFAQKPVEAGGKCPTFLANITHGIDGTRLGLSQDLPVVVEVYRVTPNAEKLVASVNLKFKEIFTGELPRGTYLIKVFSVELKSYVESMTTGPIEIPGCKKVIFQARIMNGVPVINVIVRDWVSQPAS